MRTLPAGAFQLVLAGHMHAGQIVIPYPGGKVRLAHLRARLAEGVYRFGDTVPARLARARDDARARSGFFAASRSRRSWS